jgi:hypothetical protein
MCLNPRGLDREIEFGAEVRAAVERNSLENPYGIIYHTTTPVPSQMKPARPILHAFVLKIFVLNFPLGCEV